MVITATDRYHFHREPKNEELCLTGSRGVIAMSTVVSTKLLTVVAPSPIHGKGLFARSHIKRETYIGTYEGPQAKKNGSHVLWVYDENDEIVGRRGLNKLRYLNHSDKPNAEFDGFDLYALRNIRPGEEITIDYDPF
jgi:SET domain-containing protein